MNLKRSTLLLGIGALTATSGAAVMGTMYILQDSTPLSSEDLIKRIYDNIAGLPGVEHDEFETFDEFHDDILGKIDESTDSAVNIKTVVLDKLDEEIQTIVLDIQADDALEDEEVDFIKDQMDDHAKDISELLEAIRTGYIGTHDLNYYHELLVDKVNHTVLADTVDGINAKIALTDVAMAEVKNALETELDTLRNNYQDSINDVDTTLVQQNTNLTTKIDAAVAELQSLVVTNSTIIVNDIQNKFDVLNEEVNDKVLLVEHDVQLLQTILNGSIVRINSLESHAELADASISDLNNLYLGNVELMQDLAISLADGQDVDASMQSKIDEIKVILDDSIEAERNQNTQYDELKERVHIIEDRIGDISQRMSGFESNIDEIQDNFNIASNELVRLGTLFTTVEADMNDFKTKFNALDSKVATVVADYGVKIFAIEDNVSNIMFTLDQLNSRVSANEAKIYNIEQDVAALKTDIENLKAEWVYEATNLQDSSIHDSEGVDLNTEFYPKKALSEYSAIDIVFKIDFGERHSSLITVVPNRFTTTGKEVFLDVEYVTGSTQIKVSTELDYDNNSIKISKTSTLKKHASYSGIITSVIAHQA